MLSESKACRRGGLLCSVLRGEGDEASVPPTGLVGKGVLEGRMCDHQSRRPRWEDQNPPRHQGKEMGAVCKQEEEKGRRRQQRKAG